MGKVNMKLLQGIEAFEGHFEKDKEMQEVHVPKKEEKVEAIFPGIVNRKEDIEESALSDPVYEAVKSKKSVNIHDRVTPLDYWVCVLAFVFDLNFKESYEFVKENRYIDILIDRFHYYDAETGKRMEDIRQIMNDFVHRRASEK